MAPIDTGSRLASSADEPPIFPAGLVVSLRTRDFDRMAAALPGWKPEYQQLGRGRFEGELFMVHSARLGVGAASWSPGVMIRGRVPRGCALLAIPLGRRHATRHRGSPLPANGMAVLLDDEAIDFRATSPLKMFMVIVGRAQLERHTAALLGCPLDAIREHEQVAIETPSRKKHRLEAVMRLLRSGVARDAQQLQVAGLADEFERTILDTILAGVRAPQDQVSASRRCELAWETEAFLRSNLARSTSIGEICAAMNASERTLHLAFREHIGMSPMAYVKVLRLNAVRHELCQATELTTVTRAALSWGFSHLGWFAQSYLRMFGETPIATLRRARRQARRCRADRDLQFSDCEPSEGDANGMSEAT